MCVDLWSVIYFIFHPAFLSFQAFPIHRSASFTLEWLFVGLGLFYMQGGKERSGWLWGIFLLVTKLHIERVAFYTTTLLLLDDMVDTLKNHIHFNHRNWQVAYSPFSPGLRVELRGEISSRMQGFYSCRERNTDVFNSKYWMRRTDDRYSCEKTEIFQEVELYYPPVYSKNIPACRVT